MDYIQKVNKKVNGLCDNNKELLSLKELCLYLDVSRHTVYKWKSEGKIPCYCPSGKLLYFKKSEIDAWIFSNKIHTVSELESQLCNHQNVAQ